MCTYDGLAGVLGVTPVQGEDGLQHAAITRDVRRHRKAHNMVIFQCIEYFGTFNLILLAEIPLTLYIPL